MNTDHARVDFAEVQRAMDLLGQAQSMLEVGASLDVVAAAVGLPNYLALDMYGLQPQVSNALHNLGDFDLGTVVQSDLTARLLARPIPIPMDHALQIVGLQFGIAASSPHGHRACLLFLGRSAPNIDDGSLTELLGAASMYASHLLAALVRVSREACPLSVRELQCLCLAANGLSAKETARQLGISSRTVEDYLKNCRSRLNAGTTLSAALHALGKGWLSWSDIEATGLSLLSPRSREYRA